MVKIYYKLIDEDVDKLIVMFFYLLDVFIGSGYVVIVWFIDLLCIINNKY